MGKRPWHLTLGLSRELWEDLLKAALPVKLAEGEFDAARMARQGLRQLQVRQRVAGLLEDRKPPEQLVVVTRRAREEWRKRRAGVVRRVDDLVHVSGTYRVQLDDMGSTLRYGNQEVGADAYVKGVIEGTIVLMRQNLEIPFTIEKRVGASVTLGDIRFDRGQSAIIGSLQDVALHLGEGTVMELLNRLGEYLLEQQLPRVNPVPILRRNQVDELVGGLGGSMRMKMGVESMDLQVSDEDLTLCVKFGFAHLQLEEKEGGGAPARDDDWADDR